MRPLSRREAEVLTLYDQGHSRKEIGGSLVISVHTVDNYARRILAKTPRARSLRQAAFLRRQGLPDRSIAGQGPS